MGVRFAPRRRSRRARRLSVSVRRGRRPLVGLSARRRTGDRDARAEHLRDDVPRDLRGREPDILEDLLARRVLEELVRQAELVDGGVDVGLAQVLADARADAADADAVLDGDDEAVVAREADDARRTGTTQRGSTTVAPMPWASRRSATSRPMSAIGPTVTSSTSCGADSASTSTPSSVRAIASKSAPTVPFGKRITVGASSTATASRELLARAARRRAARRCGCRARPAGSRGPRRRGGSGRRGR